MLEKKFISTDVVPESAVLVAVQHQGQSDAQLRDHLDELAFLAGTAGVEVQMRFTQRLTKPDHRTYVGKGKLEELAAYVLAEEVDIAIFDDDLTPSQVRNLEGSLKCKVLDRSLLILNIFAQRAQTAQSKTQVELAQYQYLYPRLTRMWTHLSKQRGGVGMRGPGEKELETDRRIVQDRISLLKDKLDKFDRQSVTRRQHRDRLVRVALVGYTNVGKSTLMNLMSKADVFAENKLFATVDSTVRKVVFENTPFLLTDTVGFIRKLPTHLIESFKSTLDEVREADVLVHVVDASHPAVEEHIAVVNNVLADLKAADKPTLLVFNKIDQLPEFQNGLTEAEALDRLQNSYLGKSADRTVFISAGRRINVDTFRRELLALVSQKHYAIFPNSEPPAWAAQLEELDLSMGTPDGDAPAAP
ncbi:MAG: GTPase HflX [Catalinimonas sp.]